MLIRRITTHSLQAIAEGALIAMLVVGLMAGTAFAAKGGGKTSGGTATGSLGMHTVVDADSNGVLTRGDSITFDPSTTASSKPMVSVTCTQAGATVYTHSAGYYDGYPWPDSQTFVLKSAAWTSGGATCTARGYYSDRRGGFHTFATQGFSVGA